MSNLGFPDHCIDAYLAHVIEGKSLGHLANSNGNHRSTHLRRVRRIEELRDNPDWDLIISHLAEHRRAQLTGDCGPVTRDTVCAALNMTLTDLHAKFATAAQLLTRNAHFLIVGDVPHAAISSPDGGCGKIGREIALAALGVGWIVPVGKMHGPARKYVADSTITECFVPPSFTRDEAKIDASQWVPPTHYRSRLTPLEMLANRKNQCCITPDHLRLGREFHEIYTMRAHAMAMEFDQISQALPPRTLEILVEVCGKNVGLECVEKRMELPARSAKAIIAFALDTYAITRAAA